MYVSRETPEQTTTRLLRVLAQAEWRVLNGTGVLVVCGQNSGRGGIFDYWGVPFAVGPSVVSEVGHMRGEAGRGPTSGIWTPPVKR
jgi:hypothetical protein